jgi:hypothetical protein
MSDIDAIVLSEKNGLFLIQTKANGDRIQVDGEKLLVNFDTAGKAM